MELKRHFFAFGAGLVGGLIPNDKSNIHPLLMGCILAVLGTKIVFGDYDMGYQWTWSDIVFLFIVGGEGAIGAYFTAW